MPGPQHRKHAPIASCALEMCVGQENCLARKSRGPRGASQSNTLPAAGAAASALSLRLSLAHEPGLVFVLVACRLLVVPASDPEQDVGLGCPASSLHGQGSAERPPSWRCGKVAYVGVCTLFFAKRSAKVVSHFENDGKNARPPHLALRGVPLDLDCPDLVVGSQ